MPELPEVETTRSGIEPYVVNQRIVAVRLRQNKLRWPVDEERLQLSVGQHIIAVARRGKYLRLLLKNREIMIHLGMSGSIRIIDSTTIAGKHDHLDIDLASGKSLRFNDPRRFGSVDCHQLGLAHPLLASLGPEPLSELFNTEYLKARLSNRKAPIKNALMDSKVVVGVGNIYAQEALFRAGIHPLRAANRISEVRLQRLIAAIKETLLEAIEAGGSSLKDFTQADGKPGYFQHRHSVYGRGGEECSVCGSVLKHQQLAQRTTTWCSHCQK